MGKLNQNGIPVKTRDSAGNTVFIGIICLAVGLGVGYYFGTKSGAAELPVATSSSPAQTQAPGMDPAVFLATESTLKTSLSSNPNDVKTLVDLGNLYYDNNKFQQAIDYYGKALEIQPNDVAVHTDRGSCFWSLGQADPAIAEFQKSLQLNPTHPQTLYNLGIVYLHGKSDMSEARKAWEKLLAANPDYPQRARIQQMLASMGGPAASPEAPAAGSAPMGQGKPGASNMDDLFKRMKK
jgi:tetratricopeptide (TPR) repeat protein